MEEFIELVQKVSEEKLLSDFVDSQYGTYYRNIDAMIKHTYYHLGQIVLIKNKLNKNGLQQLSTRLADTEKTAKDGQS